ncbi:hypothetical protein [Actinotignum sp. GS-2025b]|uniref:hypothetical protein n=1 Tax=Actinotignum sp. GS-2025b TaxID=3427275 RepID=UPI003F48D16A
MKKSLTAWAGTVLVACLAFAGCGSQKSNDSADSSASPASSSAAASSAADGTTTNEAVFPATIDTKFGPVTVKEAPQRVVALGWGDAEVALSLGVQPVGAHPPDLSTNRTTPTCAGKRRAGSLCLNGLWNYPHLRGEESDYSIDGVLGMELPPPARGRELRHSPRGMNTGTTPTCAGKRLPDLVVYSRRARKTSWNRVPALWFSARRLHIASPPSMAFMSVPTPQI